MDNNAKIAWVTTFGATLCLLLISLNITSAIISHFEIQNESPLNKLTWAYFITLSVTILHILKWTKKRLNSQRYPHQTVLAFQYSMAWLFASYSVSIAWIISGLSLIAQSSLDYKPAWICAYIIGTVSLFLYSAWFGAKQYAKMDGDLQQFGRFVKDSVIVLIFMIIITLITGTSPSIWIPENLMQTTGNNILRNHLLLTFAITHLFHFAMLYTSNLKNQKV
ncbi:hypothetical protein [Desulfobacula toluolica]|uniref:Uncharacterized protein n=1 Tax=Desulfobacula toluolica (strain DSM 7467 / Tol2) TaxID=651182 RepID=K0NNE9_DESTT|nr:hypothetical protein [Desulfobacula toluolica]CCK82170.1 uncharacterized protein TOL2_C40150 [Desulfobacula toluolica Tol2]